MQEMVLTTSQKIWQLITVFVSCTIAGYAVTTALIGILSLLEKVLS